MSITEKEFQALLKSNPRIKESYQKNLQKENLAKKKRNKYLNVKVYEYESGLVADDKTLKNAGKIIAVYDSVKEYNRWCELQLWQKAGRIKDLSRQIRMLIQESFVYNGEKIAAIEYVADFTYIEDGKKVVEDVKHLDPKTGKHRFTKDFVLKWKLLKHKYPDYKFIIF